VSAPGSASASGSGSASALGVDWYAPQIALRVSGQISSNTSRNSSNDVEPLTHTAFCGDGPAAGVFGRGLGLGLGLGLDSDSGFRSFPSTVVFRAYTRTAPPPWPAAARRRIPLASMSASKGIPRAPPSVNVFEFLNYRAFLRAYYAAEKVRRPAFSHRFFSRRPRRPGRCGRLPGAAATPARVPRSRRQGDLHLRDRQHQIHYDRVPRWPQRACDGAGPRVVRDRQAPSVHRFAVRACILARVL